MWSIANMVKGRSTTKSINVMHFGTQFSIPIMVFCKIKYTWRISFYYIEEFQSINILINLCAKENIMFST